MLSAKKSLLAFLGVVAKECKKKHHENSSLLSNRTALFQTHLLCMTIHGLMWTFSVNFNVRWLWLASNCHGSTTPRKASNDQNTVAVIIMNSRDYCKISLKTNFGGDHHNP